MPVARAASVAGMYSFSATRRCSEWSQAPYTMPKPPSPITLEISNSAM
jgi:hypothetical protein